MRRAADARSGALALGRLHAVGPDYRVARARRAGAGAVRQRRARPPSPATSRRDAGGACSRDPLLDRLVEQALRANTDLRVAAANLRRARAVLRETRAGRLPIHRPSARHSRLSAQEPGGDAGDLRYDAGLDVSYQLDLFGRIRRAIEASRADVEAVQAAFDVTRITVAAETARAYADACSAGRQLAVARETVRIQEQTFDLTRRLLEGGRGTALETSQAGALLEQIRATRADAGGAAPDRACSAWRS